MVESTAFMVVEHCSWLGIGVFDFKLQITKNIYPKQMVCIFPNLFKPAETWTWESAETESTSYTYLRIDMDGG